MTFQEKLVILRKTRGLTQDEFASAVGVSRQAVYKWESGQSYPEVQKLLEIKTLFTISIDDLLDDNYDVPLPEKKKRKRISKEAKEKIEKTVEKTAPAAPKAPVAPKEETAPIVEEPAAKVEETEDFKIVVNEEKAPEVNEEPAAQEEKKTGFFGRFFARK
ncbi:MAG: helix-turn-helix transcriptional regulator [Clostridia bacterium]|nr:helix-turn-helix transcriptional regulator [Clostridia bacterium]MBO5316415.1 helix-turn-helix transcriptional regulator [Clostridia bacterium]MBR3805891.1 helix-turn-helix transcriptional regulator [Clostridia bacterium]